MSALHESIHAGEHIVWEAEPNYSRDEALLTGGNFTAATVLGRITVSGIYTQYDPAANDGSEIAVAVLFAGKDASVTDQACVVNARSTMVRKLGLVWKTGLSPAEIETGLSELAIAGIIAR